MQAVVAMDSISCSLVRFGRAPRFPPDKDPPLYAWHIPESGGELLQDTNIHGYREPKKHMHIIK
eukprot:1512182-Amphidinium_carterae.1